MRMTLVHFWSMSPDPELYSRVDRSELAHILFKKCILCIQYLGRLWYAKVLNGPLATNQQYRISFNRNTMVVDGHFIREGHL